MRLLNTETYRVEEFNAYIPLYAILSHTWERREVTFQDIQDLNVAKTKSGWSKVENACIHARKHDFRYIWIDSCCVDKTSSAELSEALNSMYQYYIDAEVCYVYLCDTSSTEDPRNPESKFWSSRWFTRGWTLQELIAPMYAVFLAKDWKEIGTRWSLRAALSAITAIPVGVFEGRDIDEFSIAQRMSWAADRETTRPEDMAYCLMGIFNVNMSPIYGEGGAKAFMRLQQEIIKVSDDRSIFAWTSNSGNDSGRGLLARSPEEFRASGGVRMTEETLSGDKLSFSFSNNGLRIHLPIVPVEKPNSTEDHIFLASLHCHCPCEKHSVGSYLSIYLRKTGDHYVRYRPSEVVVNSFPPEAKDLKEIVVKENSLPRSATRRNNVFEQHVELAVQFSRLSYTRYLLNLIQYNGHLRLRPGAFSAFYQDQVEGESFSLIFEASDCSNGTREIVETVAIIQGALDFYERPFSIPDRGLPVDRVQLPMKGGVVYARLHMTGRNRRNLEIGYGFAGETHCEDEQKMSQLPSFKLGCMVPLSVNILRSSDSEALPFKFSLEDVFPPDPFDRGLKSSHQGYIHMPAHTDTPRLLTYRQKDWGLRFHVALGLHESGEAWTDVRHYDDTLTLEEIQDFYFNSGGWKLKKDSTSDTLTPSFSHSRYNITAAVRKTRDTLQLGYYSLLLNVEEESS
ncbi:hypothetical protein VKT23_014458 [Stygiomarasmius scandens]|uniref:Heterokaryon incompatibility domain-containing protein n=1 Tax=Marasmiellus scandens TaxID=2682957 RepID=A0ABR1J3C0_9AGAR